MAKHDIVVLNSTSSGFETDLGNNVARIKGDADNLFQVNNASGVNEFAVSSIEKSMIVSGDLTLTGNLSSSINSTASFGRVDGIIVGDASQMTDVNQIGHVSSSKQLAARISGAFTAGFEVTGNISGSLASTGSFTRVFANTYVGDASQMTNVPLDVGTLSGSAQIASRISGSFNKGFNLSAGSTIKGTTGVGLSGVWSAVGSAPNTLRDYAASAGSGGGTVDSSVSALMFGGRVSPASVSCTEEWNGTTWTETGDLNTDRIQHGGFGTTEAAVAVGSAPYPSTTGTKTEEFNGTSWSEVNDIGTAAGGIYGMSAGTQNSGLIFNAVNSAAPTSGTETYEYNGTNWTAGGDASVKHARGAMGGTQNSAVLFGGQTAASNTGETCTEEYDGTSFSTGGSLNVKHSEFGGDGASAANGLAVGDSYGNTEAGTDRARCTEAYNGSSWTVKTPLPYKVGSTEYQGTATKGIAFGGYWRYPNLNSGLSLMPNNYEWDDESVSAMTNTGSFGRLDISGNIVGTDFSDVTGITEALPTGIFSGSAQLASQISGAFTSGFPITQDSVHGTGNVISHSAQPTGSVTGSLVSKGFFISGSVTSTGSFSHFNMGDYGGLGTTSQLTGSDARVVDAKHGGKITILDTSELTGWSSAGFISSSAQISARISGSFNKGFRFGDSIGNTVHHYNSTGYNNETAPTASINVISGSATSTGSFGRLDNISKIVADASDTTGLSIPTGTVSGSAQLATSISGSFNKGFTVGGDISGSVISTGSFSRLNFDKLSATNVSGITGHEAGHVSGSSGIASQISGAFQHGFEYIGAISGSSDSSLIIQSLEIAGTSNFGSTNLIKNWDTALIRSATYGDSLASAISGAFQSGFSYQGTISGSATSTGSFNQIQSQELFVKEMVGVRKPISGSMNHAVYTSGSFKTDTHGRLSIPVRGKIFNSINTRQFTASGSMKDQKYRTQPGQLFVDNWGRLNMTVQTGSMVAQTAAWSTPTPTSLSGRFGGIASKSTTAGAGSAPGNAWKQYDGISVKTIPGAGTNDYGWTTGIQIAGDGVDDMITFSNGFPADYDTMVWNGSAWYKVQKTPINVYSSVVLTQGTQNDSGFIGGQYSGPHGCTLINWNGTSFHNTGQALISGRYYANGSGTTNAGLVTGGAESASPYPGSTCTEEWNGTTWATAGALGRAQKDGSTGGTQNATTYYSGYPNAYTEEYNGTAWSTGPDGPNATTQAGGSGGAGNMMQSPGLAGTAGIHIFETSYVTGSADTYNAFSQNPTGRYLLTKKLQANHSPGCVGGGSSSSEDGYGGGY